jgi:hypothetical protein
MRRPVRLGLIAAIIILLLGAGGYTVFWRIAARRIEEGAAPWAASMRAQGIDASWRHLSVGGYPFSFRIELTGARFAGTAPNLVGELTAPRLTATVGAGNLHAATLTAPEGLAVSGEGIGDLKAGEGLGTAAAGAQGGAAIWLRLAAVTAKADAAPDFPTAVKTAQLWLELPATPPKTHADRNIGIALDLGGISAPPPLQALGPAVDDVAFGITLMGPTPPGTPRQTAAGWRDAGGTLELDHFHLGWGGIDVDASGTVTLDRDLQPEGALSASVGGYDRLLAALVSLGRVKGSDAARIRLVLGLLARPGPDGKPRLSVPLTLQDGILSMGPISLGRVPKIAW